jgi:carboxyl-terminal processing protease
VGRRSFGKGLVQRNGFCGWFSVRLTIARYYTPTGRSIQSPIRKAMRLTLRNQSLVLKWWCMKKDSIKVADIKIQDKNCIQRRRGALMFFVPLEVEHGNESTAYCSQNSG